jgi:hypothetical protein
MSGSAARDHRGAQATGSIANQGRVRGACGGGHCLAAAAEQETMLNIKVAVPGVHMAGSDAHYNAHIAVGDHGLALFLSPEAEYPVLDVNGTPEQLAVFVRGLQAALASRDAAAGTDTDRLAQIPPQRAVPRAEPPATR